MLYHLQYICNVLHLHCYVLILDPITYHYFYLTCQLRTVHHQYSLHLFMPQHRYILTRPRHNYGDDSTILTLYLHHNLPHLIRARTSQYDTTYTIFLPYNNTTFKCEHPTQTTQYHHPLIYWHHCGDTYTHHHTISTFPSYFRHPLPVRHTTPRHYHMVQHSDTYN